jgi:hypothetical protein
VNLFLLYQTMSLSLLWPLKFRDGACSGKHSDAEGKGRNREKYSDS